MSRSHHGLGYLQLAALVSAARCPLFRSGSYPLRVLRSLVRRGLLCNVNSQYLLTGEGRNVLAWLKGKL
jgi:hypothetical protein